MAYKYTRIDGQRVQVNVADAFERLDVAFYEATGQHLIVASGTRTRAEQQSLYDAYLAGRGNLAAAPGRSNHEETGPVGPRALDVWDTGADPGVTTAGTKRGNWLKANAHRFGFNPIGYEFGRLYGHIEPWHIEYTGQLTNKVAKAPKAQTKEDDMILNILGKKGKRRGGLYYVSGGKATFIGYRKKSSYPLFTSEKEIATLQKRIKGLK